MPRTPPPRTRPTDTGLYRHIVDSIDVTEKPNPLVRVVYTYPMAAAIYAAAWVLTRGDKAKMREHIERELGKAQRPPK